MTLWKCINFEIKIYQICTVKLIPIKSGTMYNDTVKDTSIVPPYVFIENSWTHKRTGLLDSTVFLSQTKALSWGTKYTPSSSQPPVG